MPSPESFDLELLDSSGKLLLISLEQVKWVCYVREPAPGEGFWHPGGSDSLYPERLMRRRFTSKPRISGLWLRLTLADGDDLEGVASNDRSLIDGPGLLLTPPDTRSNTQRVFIPRTSIRELTVLGVIAPALSRTRPGSQPQLFEKDLFETEMTETVPSDQTDQLDRPVR